jgi:hypothetical protein
LRDEAFLHGGFEHLKDSGWWWKVSPARGFGTSVGSLFDVADVEESATW